MKKTAVFPGSFDPFTKGHECIIDKALNLFDEVVIGIGQNTSKNYLFSLENRKQHIESIFEHEDRVKVLVFTGLTVDFCKSIKSDFIVGGLRNFKNSGYKKRMAKRNNKISAIKREFLITVQKYTELNSTLVKKIKKVGENIDWL